MILARGSLSAGFGLLAVAQVAAQTAGAPATQAGAGTQDSIEQIVVTAEHRSENIQRAPIAIDALSQSRLKQVGITNNAELSKLVPSLQNGTAGGPFQLFFLRGVGSFAANSLTDAAVAVSIDNVPIARQYGAGGQYYDLARVEVLKGPQGTLYGRNATGGVINILPQQPGQEREANVSVTFGNYTHIQTAGMLNLPVSEKSAFRLAVQTIRHDGYLSDGQADEDSQAGRLQYRLDASDQVTLRLTADWFHQGGKGGGNALLSGGYAAGDRVGLTDPRAQAVYVALGRAAPRPQDLFIDGDYRGAKAELTWNSDLGALTAIGAYRRNDVDSVGISGPLLVDSEHDRQSSMELRYAFAETHGLKLTVGGFWLDDKVRARFEVDNLALNRTLPASGNTQNFRQGTKTWAGFADANYALSERFRLIGGIRYTGEEKSLNGTLTTYASFVPVLPINRSEKWHSTDWRAGAQFDLGDRSMLYATVSTGFHSGGFFFTHDNPTYQPERLTAYTIGSKNQFLDNRLQANLELFLWRYKNQQLSGVSVDSVGSTIFATFNAASSNIKGAEGKLDYLLASDTLLGLQVLFLDSKFRNFNLIAPFPAPAISACASSFVAAGRFQVNCSGLTPPQSPRWTVNPSIQQSFPLADGASLVANLSGHYQSRSYIATNYLPSDRQPAYFRGDFSLTYNFAGRPCSIQGFVNNFTDVAVKNSTNHPNVDSAALRPPRLFGVRLSAEF